AVRLRNPSLVYLMPLTPLLNRGGVFLTVLRRRVGRLVRRRCLAHGERREQLFAHGATTSPMHVSDVARGVAGPTAIEHGISGPILVGLLEQARELVRAVLEFRRVAPACRSGLERAEKLERFVAERRPPLLSYP